MANVESSRAKAATPFFYATAVVELGAGVVLLAAPAAVIRLLFGSAVAIFPAVGIARVAGVALLALAAACWWARADQASAAAKGLVGAMLIYNAGVPLLVLSGSLGLSVRCSGRQSCSTQLWGSGACGSWLIECHSRESNLRQSSDVRDAVHLNECTVGNCGYGDCRADRRLGTKASQIGLVHPVVVLHVGEVDRHLEDLVHR